jgi:hypothetical protein
MKIFEGMAHRKPLNFPYLYKKKKKKNKKSPLPWLWIFSPRTSQSFPFRLAKVAATEARPQLPSSLSQSSLCPFSQN